MYDILSWDKDGQVNSGFGYRSSSSTNGVGSTNHMGIDLSSYNDNIPAVVSGMISANGYTSARGYYVTVTSNDGFTQTYQHLASATPLSIGTYVTEGQTIGTQGSTGNSTAKHLHFEVRNGAGVAVDPLKYLSGEIGGGGAVTGSVNGYDMPVQDSTYTPDLKTTALSIVGNVVKVLVVIAILIAAAYLFMKAFDINIF